MDSHVLRRRIRYLLGFFIVALALSGLSALPLQLELNILRSLFGDGTPMARLWPALSQWISLVHHGLTETYLAYPFIAYGTDWLAFGHIAIAIAFLGPLRDPVKNMWVVEFGMIACVLVIPWALIFGPLRGIPVLWRLLDCSFGVFGIIPLWLARNDIRQLAVLENRL